MFTYDKKTYNEAKEFLIKINKLYQLNYELPTNEITLIILANRLKEDELHRIIWQN